MPLEKTIGEDIQPFRYVYLTTNLAGGILDDVRLHLNEKAGLTYLVDLYDRGAFEEETGEMKLFCSFGYYGELKQIRSIWTVEEVETLREELGGRAIGAWPKNASSLTEGREVG